MPADHPLASPILHPVPSRLPKTFILAAECDPLRDEARVYARKLKEAKIPVSYVLAPGMIHAFNVLTHLIPAGLPHTFNAAPGKTLTYVVSKARS